MTDSSFYDGLASAVHSPVPCPELVRRRAWECAICLREEFNDRLSLEERIRAEVVLRQGADRVGWRAARDMFALYGLVVEQRV